MLEFEQPLRPSLSVTDGRPIASRLTAVATAVPRRAVVPLDERSVQITLRFDAYTKRDLLIA